MARLPRLLVDGLPHLISLRAQHGQAMLRDEADLQSLLQLLREVAVVHRVALHAWSLLDARLELVATAADARNLSLLMQAVARRHAAAFNRRYGRRGGLWEGRFRAAVIEPGDWLLRCMVHVDLLGGMEAAAGPEVRRSSRAAHAGEARETLFSAPAAYWALGNTPFEREMAYGRRLQQALTDSQALAIEAALRGGWPLGGPGFALRLAETADRPTVPRPRGRPRREPLP